MNDTEAYVAAETGEGWEWMFLEVMGHRSHWGRARQEERFGTKMLRIDVPTYPAPPTLFDHADGKPVPPEIVWETHYYGGASIFSFTLTDEATVMAKNKPYEAPARYRLPAPQDDDDDIDPDDEVGEADARDYQHG